MLNCNGSTVGLPKPLFLLPCEKPTRSRPYTNVRIGVARDAAFSFYYEDNLDLLRQAGAEIVFFSPHGRWGALPHGLDALYFGGGYPELYAAKLSGNEHSMLSQR